MRRMESDIQCIVIQYMKIKIVCVGRLKEKYLVAGMQEYLKRLQAYCKVEVYEVAEMEIIEFETEDVITSSGEIGGGDEGFGD